MEKQRLFEWLKYQMNNVHQKFVDAYRSIDRHLHSNLMQVQINWHHLNEMVIQAIVFEYVLLLFGTMIGGCGLFDNSGREKDSLLFTEREKNKTDHHLNQIRQEDL
jgi:hypothetical protein